MKVEIKKWEDLSPITLHNLLALRINVFVVEQNCPYPELDGKDLEAKHVLIFDKNTELIGTARVLDPGICYTELSIGRVAIAENYRSKGLGHLLMNATLEFIKNNYGSLDIRISAQEHLQDFYKTHGFRTVSESYLEDDIPHVEMLRKKID